MTDDPITRLRWMADGKPMGDSGCTIGPNLLDVEREACRKAADEIERLRRALQFYANPESWDALDYTPVIGHRWDNWCYGGEVAEWALQGAESGRLGFEGEKPS